VSLIQALILCH